MKKKNDEINFCSGCVNHWENCNLKYSSLKSNMNFINVLDTKQK